MRKFLKSITGYLFGAPALLLVAFVMLIPLCYTILLSFFKVDPLTGNASFVGLQQYQRLFADDIFRLSIKNTVLWTLGSVVLQFSIGFLLANILHMDCVRFKTPMRIALMVPWVLPSVVSALVWQWMYHSDFGIINEMLKQLGLIEKSIPWTSSPKTALLSAIIINVWKMVPFVILMTEAALQNVSPELKDAAHVDGAGPLRVFWSVTVPSIANTMNTIILLLTIWTMNAFTFIFVLTEGGPAHQTEILSIYIYRTAFRGRNTGLASAAATCLFLLTTTAALLYNQYVIGKERE